ncbi:hypothetical protein QYE76_002312 [Lolium multiflorum]|uniref:Reverse transcriptase Ty1/copia-type domain-containing protein n=1 Tax=Lolium multiflorum TaxID=4521 RepID=A0AAD8RNP9_LOLMU|nr:hypothetical protein QYE76_002312 [Lolium multiflorum]
MVNKITNFKKQGKPKKGNFKKGGKKASAPPEKPKGGPKPDTDCYYYNGKGHWKRNCPKYLADLKSGLVKKKKDQSSAVPEDVPVPPAPIREEANDNDHETSNEVATEPRRSTRERTTPDWYDPCLNVMIVDNNDEDPATYEEAMMSPDSKKWQEAMKSKMGSMYDNQVWTLVDLLDSRKAVENKWIFKRKTDVDGNVTVYKARLVAKGFRQIQGVDYDETFSPVAKLKSVRILLAIAAFFDYEIWQMDVKTAFLNGDIEEELYMVQPKGFVDPKNADKMDPIIPTEPFLQTQVYDLANGGDLIFERDLFALTDFLGRTPPVFYGGQISDNGQLQWLIMANLPGKPESPMFRQIQFSLRENTWVDGLAHALQESLARLCGQNSLAIEGERFAHFARHSSVGLPLSLPYHPVLRHHVDHLDYMLYETRSALSNSRSAANHTQQQLNQYADTIKVIAKERRTLRQLVAKRDATIHRLKTKIAVLKETISTQVEQLQILEGEGEGEDIQGDGYSYVSNDNDFEPEEEEDQDFHQHLPAGMDTTFPLRIDG